MTNAKKEKAKKKVAKKKTKKKAKKKVAKSSKKSSIDNIALSILRNTNLIEQISADIAALGIAGEKQLRLTLYIIMTSRLLDKPLSAIIQGSSSSGKTFTIEVVVILMPPEEVVQAHDFTEQSFYYLSPGSLKHKVVICGERLHKQTGRNGQARDNTKAFREMVGSGVLKKVVTVRGKDGKFTTETVTQEGPIAYLESTTATIINDEDATRLLPLVADESAEQTEAVMDIMRQQDKGQAVSEARRQAIIERHHAMQRLLKPYTVRIPYIDSLTLPTNNIVTRRTFGHLRSLIKSVALLRQYQKEIKHDDSGAEYIEADAVDYGIAYRLMKPILLRIYSPLNQKSVDLLTVLLEKTERKHKSSDKCRYQSFTNQDCQDWLGVSEATIRRRLNPLVAVGIVTVVRNGKPYRYKISKPEGIKSIDIGLPTPREIAKQVHTMSA